MVSYASGIQLDPRTSPTSFWFLKRIMRGCLHAFPWRTRLRENNRTQLRQLGVLPHSRILRCSLEQRVLIINGQMVCAFVLDRILPFNFKSSMKHAITCLWSDICFHTRQVPLSSMRGIVKSLDATYPLVALQVRPDAAMIWVGSLWPFQLCQAIMSSTPSTWNAWNAQ